MAPGAAPQSRARIATSRRRGQDDWRHTAPAAPFVDAITLGSAGPAGLLADRRVFARARAALIYWAHHISRGPSRSARAAPRLWTVRDRRRAHWLNKAARIISPKQSRRAAAAAGARSRCAILEKSFASRRERHATLNSPVRPSARSLPHWPCARRPQKMTPNDRLREMRARQADDYFLFGPPRRKRPAPATLLSRSTCRTIGRLHVIIIQSADCAGLAAALVHQAGPESHQFLRRHDYADCTWPPDGLAARQWAAGRPAGRAPSSWKAELAGIINHGRRCRI